MKNIPHRFTNLNTRSPVSGAAWEAVLGGVALLEELCQGWWALRVYSLTSTSSSLFQVSVFG